MSAPDWLGPAMQDPRLAPLTALGDATRALIEAVVETDVELDVIEAATKEIAAIAERLNAKHRQPTADMNPQEIRRRFVAYNPVIGKVNPFAAPLEVEVDENGRASARIQLSRVHEGPPNAVHGGIVALLIDQLLGHAVGTAGPPGMTVSLTVNYRKPTPYDRELLVEAWHTESSGRRVRAEARISADGVTYADATALFISVSPERRAELLRGDEESPLA
ncbi:MAG: PaaI family thioesterase [Actinomycetes bacterium]